MSDTFSPIFGQIFQQVRKRTCRKSQSNRQSQNGLKNTDSTPRFAFCGKCATGKTVPALARSFRTTNSGSTQSPLQNLNQKKRLH